MQWKQVLDRKPIIMQGELSIVSTRGAAAFAWDRDTIAHASRLVRPTQATAHLLGLSREQLERIGWAALLHDLGKIAIPRAILYRMYRKPLSQKEARAELQRCAGHQFGPLVVATFLQVMDEPGTSYSLVRPSSEEHESKTDRKTG